MNYKRTDCIYGFVSRLIFEMCYRVRFVNV